MTDWRERLAIIYGFAVIFSVAIFSQISTDLMWLILAVGSTPLLLLIPFFAQKFVDRRFERLAEEAGHQDRYITPLPWAYRLEMLLMGLFHPYRHAAVRLYAGGRMNGAIQMSIRNARGIPFDRVYGKLSVGLLYTLHRAARTERTPFREILTAYTAAAEKHGPEAVIPYISLGRSPLEGLEYLEHGISPEYAMEMLR